MTPNQEMLDRMPEVSRETLKEALGIPETTLAQQAGALQRELYASIHADCQQRIAALEADRAALRGLLGKVDTIFAPNQVALRLSHSVLAKATGERDIPYPLMIEVRAALKSRDPSGEAT